MIKFSTELLDYQLEGVEKLIHFKVGALFMEQGTGKTRTALELAQRRLIDCKVNKILWLCPCSVKDNLRNDIIKHCGEFPTEIEICGIETLSSSIRANIECIQYVSSGNCYLIVDESLLVKNPNALRTKNIIRLSQMCQYKLILNGTPISRTEADLFAQFYILDWRILGYKSYWSFSANHLELDEVGRIVRCLNTDYLAKKIEPYSYEVKKKDVLNLPKKKHYYKYFFLTSEQNKEYQRVMELFLSDVNEFKQETIYRLFTALQLVLSGRKIISKLENHINSVPMFKNLYENPRIQAIIPIIDEYFEKNIKCIIFCKYTHEIEDLSTIISQKFGTSSCTLFHGNMSLNKRNKAIKDFETTSNFMIANKNCAGFGLNLQFCNDIIYYSNDWNYATRIQSEDRCHRIGQNNDVIITDIVAWNKLDDRISCSLLRKENLIDRFKRELKAISNIRKWLEYKEVLSMKMIRIGFDTQMKSNLVNEYLAQNPNINKIYVFYFKKTKHNLDIKINIPIEYIEFADTEMYVFYYRLLEEVDNNKLIIIDEIMRSTAKNRKQLKYNCIHKYLNQTTHRIIFEYYPIIEKVDDFMILLDFYDMKFKMHKFDESFLSTEDIKCIPRRLDITTVNVPISDEERMEYENYKNQLFDDLGNKSPETVPSALQLFVGNLKRKFIFNDKKYVARNKRFKKKNVVAYGDVKEPLSTQEDFTFIDGLMNRLHFNDFLKNTNTSKIVYLTTGLSIDEVTINEMKRVEAEKEKIYAKTSLYT